MVTVGKISAEEDSAITERLLPDEQGEGDDQHVHVADDKSRHREAHYQTDVLCSSIKKRYVMTFWAFLGFFNVYCLRVNLSVALVAMVNSTNTRNDSEGHECIAPNDTMASKLSSGEFNWDEETQGWILSAFFYGYIFTQLPGGYLAARFGGKWIFGLGVLSTSLLTLLTPIAARLHVGFFIALRVLEGLGEGVTFPAMHAMFGNWAPVWERSRLAGFAYAGAQLGTVFSMPISGLLCDSDFLGGWPSVFYVFGVLGIIWVIGWMLIIHETPADHPTITKRERDFIERSIGTKEHVATPWRKIFSSSALWGIAAAHMSANWLLYLTLTCLPTYMKHILKFDMKSNGFLSALPYLVLWFVQIISSWVADFLRKNKYLTTQRTRKLMNSAGLLLPTAFILGVGYTRCDHVLAVVLLTLAVGSGGMTMAGYNVNHLDIAPKFAGVLLGITNALATIPGFVAPMVVGVLTNHNETSGQWKIIFYMSAGILFTGALIFAILARGEELPWAKQSHVSGTWTQIIPEPDCIQEEDNSQHVCKKMEGD